MSARTTPQADTAHIAYDAFLTADSQLDELLFSLSNELKDLAGTDAACDLLKQAVEAHEQAGAAIQQALQALDTRAASTGQVASPGAAQATPQSQAPQWLQSLLYMAAEQLAMQWNAQAASIDFKAMAGSADDATFRASVVCDPLGSSFRLVVFHPATGRYVCRSQAVVLDSLDAENWNTDLAPAVAEGEC